MKDKLQEYALMAEIISAICIVLSLIFVGYQVRLGAEETAANSRAIMSAVRQSLMDADRELLLFSAEHIPVTTTNNPDTVSEEEFQRVWVWMIAMVRTRENYWLQYQDGLLDEQVYESYMQSFIRNLGDSERFVAGWRRISGEHVPGFVQETDLRLEEYLKSKE